MDSSLLRQEVEDEVEGLEEGEEKVCDINNLFLQTLCEGGCGVNLGSCFPTKNFIFKNL